MKRLLPILFTVFFSYGITIDEAVKKALNKNPEIKSYRKDVEISKAQLKIDKNFYYPEIFLQFSHTWLSQTPYFNIPANPPIPPISFKQMEKSFNNFEFGFNYLIFSGGKRTYKLQIDRLDIRASYENLSEKEKELVSEVKKAYIDVLKAKSVLEIYRKQLEAVKAHYERVKGFYEEGYVSYVELLQAKVKISEVERNIKSAEESLKLAKSHLLTLMGEDPDSDITVEPIILNTENSFNIKDLKEKALKNRNILKFLKYQEKKISKLEDIEKSDFYPKVFSQGKMIYTDQVDYLDPKLNFSFTIGMKVSFQGIQPYHKMLKAKLQEKKLRLKLQDVKNKILLQVQNAYRKMVAARENLKVSQRMLEQAQEYYRLVVEQYKNQLATTTDVLNAEAQLTSARYGKEISYYDYLQAIFELEKAVGMKLFGGD